MRKGVGILCVGFWMAALAWLLSGCGDIDKFFLRMSEEAGQRDSRIREDEVVSHASDCYVYNTLDENTKKVYVEIYQAIENHSEKVSVSTNDINVLDQAYQAVGADHGEIYWVSGYVYTSYTMGNKVLGIDFSPKFTMNEEERRENQEAIMEATETILSDAPLDGASDYEKAKYVFEYLAANVDYEKDAKENQNIISVFLYKKTVCQGYASATQYLLKKLGIQSSIIVGAANGQPHAWNLVRLNGKYYYVDTTWGNSTYSNGGEGARRFVNYNYFGVTSDELGLTHTADTFFSIPECTAIEDNYHIREGRYFREWNPEAVGLILKEAYEKGSSMVSVKFSSPELYERMKQYLIEEGGISEYLEGISPFYYAEDTSLHILTISFF